MQNVQAQMGTEMTWTSNVTCSRCGGFDWEVIDGVWTCGCLKQMTMAEIAEYHATLDGAR